MINDNCQPIPTYMQHLPYPLYPHVLLNYELQMLIDIKDVNVINYSL